MAASIVTLYAANQNALNARDLVSATVNLALLTSSYTPNAAVAGHQVWADISGNEISAAGGYSAGGVALASKAATAVTGGYKFASANAAWSTSSPGFPAWRYGVLYVVGSLWGLTNPVVGYFLGDSTPADIPLTSAGGTVTVYCPANGWFDSK